METVSNGIRIRFEVHGGGAPVLLVHGYPLSGALWDEFIPHLESDFRLIVPDLRGHGGSEAGDSAGMDELADDLVAVLEAADEGRPVVLVGMSMGGYAALAFCRRHRQRVRALALVDSKAGADTQEAADKRRETAARVLREGSAAVADVAKEMAGKLFAPGVDPSLRDAWRERMAGTSPTGIAAALRGMADRPDSSDLLRELGVPVLVVVGEEDEITPVEGAREMAAASGARLEIVEGAGHAAPVERPREVAAVLRSFLEGLG